MMIEMRTGDIWGFPTLAQSPYPIDATKSDPHRSRPLYLGRFVLSDAVR
jgi:hypothetical protein